MKLTLPIEAFPTTKLPPETLKDAATLTLWFSDLRKSGKSEVIYTLRKFVKKGKGFKPGSVKVEREKSLWIESKEDRLKRLKGESNPERPCHPDPFDFAKDLAKVAHLQSGPRFFALGSE
jgi:hypothetical protein